MAFYKFLNTCEMPFYFMRILQNPFGARLKRSRAPDKLACLACQGRRERLQQAPGAFAQPGFGRGMITQPPKVGNGTRRLQKRRDIWRLL